MSTWNLKSLFKNDNDPSIEKELKRVQKEASSFVKKWKNRKDYLSNPKALKKALDDYEYYRKIAGADGKVGFYFWLRKEQDATSNVVKAKFNKIVEFGTRIENEIQFFELNLSKIDKKNQNKFLKSKELFEYNHFLEKIFRMSPYLLPESEEKIMNFKLKTAYSNWVKMLSGFLSKEEREVLNEKGKKEKKTMEEIITLTKNKNKKVRDSAAFAFNDILEKNAEIAENEINSVLENKKIDDEIRKVERPDLLRHIADDMDTQVVDKLVSTITKKGFKVAKDYYKLKAKLLGLKKLAYHERGLDYGKVDLKFTYKQASQLIHKVLTNLDPEFSQIFKDFEKNGQIDIYPRKGKRGGAFCAWDLQSLPTFIMLNFTDTLYDVLTLAHELGHGINNELSKKKLNSLNFSTPISTTEVASTFMEDFVLEELLKTANPEQKLSIMMTKLNDDVSTIFRQIACYNFETDLHKIFRKEGYLSKEKIGKIFTKHMKSYMGDYVDQSKGSENWWIYWSHIRNFFYVYSYASGLLISKSLQNSVRKDPKFIKKVKEFLSKGGSESPYQIFKHLGIDIKDTKFWEKGIKEIEEHLKETEILARKLKKI